MEKQDKTGSYYILCFSNIPKIIKTFLQFSVQVQRLIIITVQSYKKASTAKQAQRIRSDPSRLSPSIYALCMHVCVCRCGLIHVCQAE